MQVAIIKYNAGNIFSVDCALRRIGVDAVTTDDPRTILAADKVIFPGVGEARAAMEYLQQHGLDELIRSITKPLLGICIGTFIQQQHQSLHSPGQHLLRQKLRHLPPFFLIVGRNTGVVG